MEQKYWFSSDHHFWHHNIIKYANRPFQNVEEMNEVLKQRHNSVVDKNDIVYFLGDFAFSRDVYQISKLIKSLNGQKFLVFGNHDKIMREAEITKCFNKVFHGLAEIQIKDESVIGGKQSITLCHYPMLSWNKAHRGAIQLYGHEHGNLAHLQNHQQLDVGVDCWDFYPASYEQVKSKLASLNKRNVEHH